MLLTAVQACATLDFVGLMPLGPQLMRSLGITPGQLGVLAAVYTIAAAVSGIAGSSYVDRFDRKRAVLVLFGGFLASTLFTALAPDYHALLAARAIAGAFGGVLTANLIAILADVTPIERRGRAIGVLMSAFSIASILGLPISLMLATAFSWRASYVLLAVIASAVFIAVAIHVPPVRGHIAVARQSAGAALRAVFASPIHRRAWLFTGLVSFSGFLMIPFISPFLVLNTGVGEGDLPLFYLVGGIAALGSARLAGQQCDRRGARWTFLWLSIVGILVVLVLSHLARVPLLVSLFVSTALFATFPGRMVATMATVTAAAEPALRGSFMSLNATIQHLGSGAAILIASSIVGRAADGGLLRFDVIGYLSAAAMTAAIVVQRRVRGPRGG